MSKNNAHKQKHKTVFVILLILGILIFLFGITGLFAAPPFGIAFMVVGVAITIPFFVSGMKQKNVSNNNNDESKVYVFITPTGKKYHKDPGCAGEKCIRVDINEAQSKGYTACSKCEHFYFLK